jgi:cytidyltransferase-like protein
VHGVFDILHIGHFRHLREAYSLGDRLVVSITAAEFVTKGQGHPAHTDAERLEQLMSLRMVSDVYLCQEPTGATAIMKYRPNVYVKGVDYAKKGIIKEEADACEAVGAVIKFTGSEKRNVLELVGKFK